MAFVCVVRHCRIMAYRYPNPLGVKKKKPRRIEHGIQSKFISTVEPMLRPSIYIYAIPNGGFRLKSEAIRLGDEGVKRGPTDLFVIAPRGVSAWLETKTKTGSLGDEQIGFRTRCMENGHLWGMYRTIEEGVAQMRAWGFLK